MYHNTSEMRCVWRAYYVRVISQIMVILHDKSRSVLEPWQNLPVNAWKSQFEGKINVLFNSLSSENAPARSETRSLLPQVITRVNEYCMSRRIWQKRPQSTEAVPILVAFTSSLGTDYLRNSGLSMCAICSITRNRGNRSFFICSLLDSFLYQCPLCKPRSWWNLWFQGIFCTNLEQFACHQSASTNYK